MVHPHDIVIKFEVIFIICEITIPTTRIRKCTSIIKRSVKKYRKNTLCYLRIFIGSVRLILRSDDSNRPNLPCSKIHPSTIRVLGRVIIYLILSYFFYWNLSVIDLIKMYYNYESLSSLSYNIKTESNYNIFGLFDVFPN